MWTAKDHKKDTKERNRTTRQGARAGGGTSGRYSKGYKGEPSYWQSSQKDSPHKQARGVKTKGVKKPSDRLSPATTSSIALRRKLPEQTIEKVETEAFANPPKGMKFPTTGVKKGNLKDLEKHNKDLRAKKEEVEMDEVNKHQARAFGSALIRNKLPRQLKNPKKEKMVGTKTGTKVVNRNDPKYKNAPEHESVESPWIRAAVAHLDKTVDEKAIMGVKVKKLGTQKDSETADVRKAQSGDKDALVRQQKRQKFGYKKEDAVDEKTIMGVKVKKVGTQKDSETADVKKAQSGDKDALVRQQRRQKFGYKTS